MTELPHAKLFDRVLPTSLLVLCVFLWGVTVVYNTKWIPGDQDGFFIHQTSFLGDGSSDKTEYLFNLSRNAEVLGLSEYEKNDLAAKIRSTTNYLVLSGTLYVLRQLYPPDDADQFGRYVGESILWAWIIIVVAAAIVMFVLFISVKKHYKQWPYCLALFICLTFSLEYIVLSSPEGWRFSEQNSFTAFLGVATHFMFNPGLEFSLFGVYSRNAFTALLVCCYALRWSERLPWCYPLLVALGFVHQAYGMLMITIMIIVDLICRPHLFRNWLVLVSVVIGIVMGLFNQSLHEGAGTSGGLWLPEGWGHWIGTALVIGALCVLGLLWRAPSVRTTLSQFRDRSIGKFSVVSQDVILLLLAAIGLVTLSWLMTQQLGAAAVQLSWLEMSVRPVALFRIGILLGASVLVVRGIANFAGGKEWMPMRAFGLALAVVLVLGLAGVTGRFFTIYIAPTKHFATADEQFKAIIGRNDDEPLPKVHRYTLLQYAIARSLAHGDASFERLAGVFASRRIRQTEP